MGASKAYNSAMRKFFDRYANDREDMRMRSNDENADDKIGPNGISRLLSDLQLSSTDRRVLIIVAKAKVQVQCELTWNEFRECLTTLRAKSVDSLRKRLEEMDRNLVELADFKELYNYTFDYGKSAGQRNLDLETAIVYWNILFKDQFALLPMWEEYLQTEYKKPVTKDTWKLLFHFAMTIRPDLTNYDDQGAWPVVLDNFVSWARPRIAPPRNE